MGWREVGHQIGLVPVRQDLHHPAGQGVRRQVRQGQEHQAAHLRLKPRPRVTMATAPLPQAEAGPASLLSVNGIEVIYNHVILVLKGVSLEVPEGGIVALLGGNGAGKTTTLRAISNLLRGERGEVTKGSIELRGERIEYFSP